MQHNNAVGHKRNENAIAGVARLNIPVVIKAVTVEVKKVEVETEVATSSCCHCTTATVDHQSEVVE